MSTKNIVPRANNEGQLGTDTLRWASGNFQALYVNGAPITSGGGSTPKLVTVANQTARFALTGSDVNVQDLIYQTDTSVYYTVKDKSNLANANGYLQFSSVFNQSLNTTDSVTFSAITGNGASLTNLNATNIATGTIAAARLPNPSSTTLGGVRSAAAVTHQWINSISTAGIPSLSQPAAADISGLGTAATVNTDTNINLGTSSGSDAVVPTQHAVKMYIANLGIGGGVSNPLSADLDANNHSIYSVSTMGINGSCTMGRIYSDGGQFSTDGDGNIHLNEIWLNASGFHVASTGDVHVETLSLNSSGVTISNDGTTYINNADLFLNGGRLYVAGRVVVDETGQLDGLDFIASSINIGGGHIDAGSMELQNGFSANSSCAIQSTLTVNQLNTGGISVNGGAGFQASGNGFSAAGGNISCDDSGDLTLEGLIVYSSAHFYNSLTVDGGTTTLDNGQIHSNGSGEWNVSNLVTSSVNFSSGILDGSGLTTSSANLTAVYFGGTLGSMNEGTLSYDASTHKLKVYTGSLWETVLSA